MPSIKKFFTPSSHVTNPYANPNHPTNIATPLTTPASKPFRSQPPPPPRQASPRGSFDYLAEAREAVGRDPVTGRSLVNQPPARRTGVSGDATSTAAEASHGSGSRNGGAVVGGAVGRTSAYGDRNEGVKKTHGTKYDLFVQQMRDREKGVWREPEGGFYAPGGGP